MLENLKLQIEEIIEMCNACIKENTSPNLFEINVIKREFTEIRDVLNKEKKIVVLTKEKDLWAYKVILDSAKLDFDRALFEKVYKFQRNCEKLPLKDCKVLY